jgi:hypothetical protein
MVAHRFGRVELQMWRDGQPITRSFLAEHQTHPYWHQCSILPPDGHNLHPASRVEVQLRSLMPIGADWWLTRVETSVNNCRLGEQTLALRFAAMADEWPTAVQPLIVPLTGSDGMANGYETWYLTVRGDGSEEAIR